MSGHTRDDKAPAVSEGDASAGLNSPYGCRMWRRGPAEPQTDERFACAFCNRELQPGDPWVTADLEQGVGALPQIADYLWFCDQEHAGRFLVEGRLTTPYDAVYLVDREDHSNRLIGVLKTVGVVILVAANLGFYVLGFITLLRWIWA